MYIHTIDTHDFHRLKLNKVKIIDCFLFWFFFAITEDVTLKRETNAPEMALFAEMTLKKWFQGKNTYYKIYREQYLGEKLIGILYYSKYTARFIRQINLFIHFLNNCTFLILNISKNTDEVPSEVLFPIHFILGHFTLKSFFNTVQFVFRGRVFTAENDQYNVLLKYISPCDAGSNKLYSYIIGKCIIYILKSIKNIRRNNILYVNIQCDTNSELFVLFCYLKLQLSGVASSDFYDFLLII